MAGEPELTRRGLIQLCQTMSMAGKSFMPNARLWLMVSGLRWRSASHAFKIAMVRKEPGRAVARKRRRRSVASCSGRQSDEIEVWGDGSAVRSYTYIDDMLDGIYRLMQSDLEGPANIGNPEYVTVDELVATVAAVSSKQIKIRHVKGPVASNRATSVMRVSSRSAGERSGRSVAALSKRILGLPLRSLIVQQKSECTACRPVAARLSSKAALISSRKSRP